MKGKSVSITSNLIVPLGLALICAVVVYVSLAGKSLPLVSSPRAALIILLVVGMAACMGGIGQVSASGRWASPLAIVGYLLGAAILLVIVAAFAGWQLPLVGNEIQAIAVVAVLLAAKLVIGVASYFFHWL